MYKQLLKSYIEKMTKVDIIKYIEKNNYQVSDKEIETIYFYIKNYWEDFFDNKEEVWKKLKSDVSDNTYVEILKLFNKYKNFI